MSIQIRDKRRPSYFTIDNEVLDNYGLSATATLCYIAICRCERDGCTKYSATYLASKVGLSRATFVRHLPELIQKKLIHSEYSQGENSTLSLLQVKKNLPQIEPTPASDCANHLPQIEPLTKLDTKPISTPSASDSPMAGGDGGLHHEVAKTIQQEYERTNKIKCPWDVSEGTALKKLLKANPSWDFTIIRKMVMNRFLSDGVNGERPRSFIPHLSRWAAGPLDRYGKLKEQKAAEQYNLIGGYEEVMARRRANGF